MKAMTLIEFVESVAGKPLTDWQKAVLVEYTKRADRRAALLQQYDKRFDPASTDFEKAQAFVNINGRYGKMPPHVIIIDDPLTEGTPGDADAFRALLEGRPAPSLKIKDGANITNDKTTYYTVTGDADAIKDSDGSRRFTVFDENHAAKITSDARAILKKTVEDLTKKHGGEILAMDGFDDNPCAEVCGEISATGAPLCCKAQPDRSIKNIGQRFDCYRCADTGKIPMTAFDKIPVRKDAEYCDCEAGRMKWANDSAPPVGAK